MDHPLPPRHGDGQPDLRHGHQSSPARLSVLSAPTRSVEGIRFGSVDASAAFPGGACRLARPHQAGVKPWSRQVRRVPGQRTPSGSRRASSPTGLPSSPSPSPDRATPGGSPSPSRQPSAAAPNPPETGPHFMEVNKIEGSQTGQFSILAYRNDEHASPASWRASRQSSLPMPAPAHSRSGLTRHTTTEVRARIPATSKQRFPRPDVSDPGLDR